MQKVIVVVCLELAVVEILVHVWLRYVEVEEVKQYKVWKVDE